MKRLHTGRRLAIATARYAIERLEPRMLLAAGRGEALLLAGSHRVAFQTVASTREHQLAAGLADLLDEADL